MQEALMIRHEMRNLVYLNHRNPALLRNEDQQLQQEVKIRGQGAISAPPPPIVRPQVEFRNQAAAVARRCWFSTSPFLIC